MFISAASKAQGFCPGTAHMLSFDALQPSQDVEDKELLTEAKASALVQVRQNTLHKCQAVKVQAAAVP